VERFDAIVIGGGPAGLAAGLMLGRCRRRAVVLDHGQPRNAASQAVHGYLSRDGIAPAELLRHGRAELGRYGVELRHAEAVDAIQVAEGFEVTLADGTRLRSRKLLVATGVRDRLPDVEGLRELYGVAVHHCPYCDGWEHRDQPLAAYGRGRAGAALALKLTAWSPDVVLLTDGPARLRRPDRERLAGQGVAVREERLARLEASGPRLEQVVFASGERLARRALFFSTGQDQACEFLGRLRCGAGEKGPVSTDNRGRARVPGLFVAGDASRDMQLAIVAAAEGAKAGIAIHEELADERLE
jgi:thioredoxin reductase